MKNIANSSDEGQDAMDALAAFVSNFQDQDDEIMIVLEEFFKKICGEKCN
jgi:hypothetical protein